MTLDFDSRTCDLLDEIASELDRAPNWDDVLIRAGEAASATRRGRWVGRTARRLTVVAAVAVTLIAVVALSVFGRGATSLTDRALAAIGGGPVTHTVVVQGLNDRLVNLRTGQQSPAPLRVEAWSDARRGIVMRRTSLGQTQTLFVPTSQEPTSAFTSFFLTNYRAQLRRGEVRQVGKGRIDGQDVYWIESPAGTVGGTNRIALSQHSYKPVYFVFLQDGHPVPGTAMRILAIESQPLDPALFRNAARYVIPDVGPYPPANQTTLADAARAMNHQPVVPVARIDGLQRVWTSSPAWLIGSPTRGSTPTGVLLFYGATRYGQPDSSAHHIAITEYTHYNPVLARPFGGSGNFPDNGTAVLRDNNLTLKRDGLWITIEASNPQLALAAGKAITAH
jgi:hypothetical protein